MSSGNPPLAPLEVSGTPETRHSTLLISPDRRGTTETRYSAPRSSMRTLKLIRIASATRSPSSTSTSASGARCCIIASSTHKAWELPTDGDSSCQTWNPASGSSVHTGGDTGQPWRSIQAETAPTVSGGTVGAVRMTSDGSRLFQGTMRRMPGQQPSPQLRFSEWFLWSATGVGLSKSGLQVPVWNLRWTSRIWSRCWRMSFCRSATSLDFSTSVCCASSVRFSRSLTTCRMRAPVGPVGLPARC